MGTRILVAEDDAVSRHLLRKLLRQWGYTVIEVDNGTAALHLLEYPGAPKLAILDWMMPGLNGLEVVRKLRQSRPTPYTYVLLLSANSEKSDILTGLDSGADDYLTKPFDALELRARLRVGERIIDLHSSLESALSASEFRASHDSLTGLYNRPTIMSLLQREIERSAREHSMAGIMLADIDHFKLVNDTYGHPAGDQVLLEVAARMHSALRPYDLLGRYGGEEFIIVAPGCGPQETAEVAERLRRAVARIPVLIDENNLTVTISVGATIASSPGNVGALLKCVDSALYDAKRNGRNRVEFTEPLAEESVYPSGVLVPGSQGLAHIAGNSPSAQAKT